jgi:Fe-S-cluster containining protein
MTGLNEAKPVGHILLGKSGRVPFDHVYFAFASGRFEYDCVSCNAQCCRGHGYRLDAGAELDSQKALAPHLMFFMRPSRSRSGDDNGVQVYNCPPGCFFLDQKGRCDIQTRYGYRAKPETCRLFPFNNLRLIGDHLVVAPHPKLCPLQVTTPPSTSRHSSHDDLLEELRAGGITIPIVSEAHREPGDLGSEFDVERRIVALSEEHLNDSTYSPFAAAQLAEHPASLYYRSIEKARVEVQRHLASVLRVLGLDASILAGNLADVARPLIAATPFLRSQLRWPPGTTPPYARVSANRVPHVILGLFVALVLARRAGLKEVTFQTVTRLWHSDWPLLTLLSHSSATVSWRHDLPTAPPADARPDEVHRLVLLTKALLGTQRSRPPELGTILARVIDLDGVERFTCLRRLAGSLLAGFASVDHGAGAQRHGWLGGVRRLAWQHLDAGLLANAIARRQSAVK